MWVTLNNGFFSIVENAHNRHELLVRARRKDDIPRVFRVPQQFTPDRDYPYRVSLARVKVAEVLARSVMGVDYSNFKDSIPDHTFHDACTRVWSTMFEVDDRVAKVANNAQRSRAPRSKHVAVPSRREDVGGNSG